MIISEAESYGVVAEKNLSEKTTDKKDEGQRCFFLVHINYGSLFLNISLRKKGGRLIKKTYKIKMV